MLNASCIPYVRNTKNADRRIVPFFLLRPIFLTIRYRKRKRIIAVIVRNSPLM